MSNVFKLQKQAASALGISGASLREWMKEPGFPDCSQGYDVEEIQRWRADHGKKGSADGEKLRKIKIAREAQRLRLDKLKADQAEREDKIAQGDILPRDELALSIVEHLQLARDRLLTIPKTLCRHLPKKYHRALQREGDKEVRKVLEELARGLHRLEDDHTQG